MTQLHILVATELITGATTLGTPIIGENLDILTASGISSGTPILGVPNVTQTHALNATELTLSATVGHYSVYFSQIWNPDYEDIVSGIIVIGEPTLTQTQSLVASGITTGNPSCGPPSITQLHVLTATGISVTPTIGSTYVNFVTFITNTDRAFIVEAESRTYTVLSRTKTYVVKE